MIGDVGINKIIAPNKVPVGSKYFIRYESDYEEILPLCKMLPKMSACRRDFDGTKYMYS